MFHEVNGFSAGTFKFSKEKHQYVPIFPNLYSKEDVDEVKVSLVKKHDSVDHSIWIEFRYKKTHYKTMIDLSNIRTIRYTVKPKSGPESFDTASVMIRLKVPAQFNFIEKKKKFRCVSPFRHDKLDDKNSIKSQLLSYWNLDQTFFITG